MDNLFICGYPSWITVSFQKHRRYLASGAARFQSLEILPSLEPLGTLVGGETTKQGGLLLAAQGVSWNTLLALMLLALSETLNNVIL